MTGQHWAALGAALYLAGLFTLLGVRDWQHRRVTGRTGFNRPQGRTRWASAAGLLFADAVLAGAAGLLLAAASLIPILTPPALVQPLGLAGAALTVGGLSLAWTAQAAMGDSWRVGVDTGKSTELVTAGFFTTVRNPIFAAVMIAQAGTVLMAATWLSLAGLAALVAACHLQVRQVEEPHLAAVHGRTYAEYTARTGRFIPVLGRTRLRLPRNDKPQAPAANNEPVRCSSGRCLNVALTGQVRTQSLTWPATARLAVRTARVSRMTRSPSAGTTKSAEPTTVKERSRARTVQVTARPGGRVTSKVTSVEVSPRTRYPNVEAVIRCDSFR